MRTGKAHHDGIDRKRLKSVFKLSGKTNLVEDFGLGVLTRH